MTGEFLFHSQSKSLNGVLSYNEIFLNLLLYFTNLTMTVSDELSASLIYTDFCADNVNLSSLNMTK